MCVIIHRLPNIIIPSDKIESACIVNADGFGLAVADRGKIELIKELNPKGNDPERVLKLLEETKDLPILLHLRYKTVGAVNEANCHPFVVTTDADDGIDIVMCHNGTMNQFNITGNDFSDSYMFNEMLLKPLLERSLCSPDVDPEAVLDDELLQLVLNEFVPSSSIVSLLDGNGKSLHIHETSGFEHEGWWSSNNYSFNTQHRVKSVTTFPNSTTTYYGSGAMGSWEDAWDDANADQEPEAAGSADYEAMQNGNYSSVSGAKGHSGITNALPTNIPTTYDDSDTNRNAGRAEEFTKIRDTITEIRGSPCPSNSMLRLATSDRPNFATICRLNNLKEVCRLEREDITELVFFYPEATIVLIQDLLRELYIKPHLKVTKAMDDAAEFRDQEKKKGTALVVLPSVDKVLAELASGEACTHH
ncbi:class II glutamine amidotransferase [Bradyrhizobium erythrophlei]|uniref:Glutamine amidotransferases class-II n=1 Tax=Bradyrhizobium erythrophlei TaxID=1437360 RepID=A0A1M5TA99_9BRAD|nr:class II glutamine amidotransferase [Bradyrhizobium erythrophlei]SHH47644.1 Glutamine amidotransferases class-II [Bradyrhizobium erythrophlei]